MVTNVLILTRPGFDGYITYIFTMMKMVTEMTMSVTMMINMIIILLFSEDGDSQGSGSPPPTPDRSPNNDG